MSFIKSKEHLSIYGFENKIMQFEVSSATVVEAAVAVGCTEGEIAKTLSFFVADNPILIVVAGNAKIDNAKYKKEFKTKAKMIPYSDVELSIGHKCWWGLSFWHKRKCESLFRFFIKTVCNSLPCLWKF